MKLEIFHLSNVAESGFWGNWVNYPYPSKSTSLKFDRFLIYNITILFSNYTTFLEIFSNKNYPWISLLSVSGAINICLDVISYGCKGDYLHKQNKFSLVSYATTFSAKKWNLHFYKKMKPSFLAIRGCHIILETFHLRDDTGYDYWENETH